METKLFRKTRYINIVEACKIFNLVVVSQWCQGQSLVTRSSDMILVWEEKMRRGGQLREYDREVAESEKGALSDSRRSNWRLNDNVNTKQCNAIEMHHQCTHMLSSAFYSWFISLIDLELCSDIKLNVARTAKKP